MSTLDRSRPRLLLAGLAVAAVALTAILAGTALPSTPAPTGHVPAATGSTRSTDAGAGLGAAPIDVGAIPAVDPLPWTRVDWREVPKAFGNQRVPGHDRIDGLIAGGPGLIGWGRVSQPGRNQFNDMGAIYQSANGIAWTVVPLDAGVGRRDASEIQLVTAGPAGMVVFGDVCCTDEERPALWRSADGRTWQRLPFPAALGQGDELTRIVGTADGYVLAGRSRGVATIWTSTDGATWTAVDGAAAGFGAGSITDVARTRDGLVAVGYLDVAGTYDGALWTSADGASWSRVTAEVLGGNKDTVIQKVVVWAGGWFLTGLEGPHAERVRCEQIGRIEQLASMNGRVDHPAPGLDLSCGWGSEVHWLTADGIAWQRVPAAGAQPGAVAKPGELIEFRLVAAGGPGLVVLGEGSDVGAASIFVSTDGVTWQPTAPDQQFLAGIVPYGVVISGRAIAAVADGPSAWIGTVR
jgi:hypothetical protein